LEAEYPTAPLLLHAEEPADHPTALIVAREGDNGVTGIPGSSRKIRKISLEVIELPEAVAVVLKGIPVAGKAEGVVRGEKERNIATKALMAPTVAALDTDIDAGPVLDRRRKRSRWRCFSQYIGRRSHVRECEDGHRRS